MEFNKKNLSNEELILIYNNLLLARMIEEKMLLLLRQGKIEKWFSGIGQKAIAIGSTLAVVKMNGSYHCIVTWGCLLVVGYPYINYSFNGKAI